MSDDGGLKEAFEQNVAVIEAEWTAMLPITDMVLEAFRKAQEAEGY